MLNHTLVNPLPEVDKIKKLHSLGINVDRQTGHLSYSDKFIPLTLSCKLVFIRHGETYGNCGQATVDGKIDKLSVQNGFKNKDKRIFQGDVDTEINQLTENGKTQAISAAYQLEDDLLSKCWTPDIIISSPLRRAMDTAHPFVMRNLLMNRFFCDSRIKEISFGSWENRRICDFSPSDNCHSFYKNQNALIKSLSSSLQSGNSPESFCDLLIRAYDFLHDINRKYPNKKIILYSHSMFGGACCILLGKGLVHKDKHYILFDGSSENGQSCVLPHAVPIVLNFKND